MIGGPAIMSNMGQIKILDTIQGTSFLAIRAAMGTFQRHRLDLAPYKILVVNEENSVVVVFTDKDGQEQTRRSIGVRQGFDVEMSARDLQTLMSNIGQFKVLDTIQGTSFSPIQAAAAVFQDRKLDLAQYKITVAREGNSVVVTFVGKNGQLGTRGNPSARPGFEVELDVRDLRVLRSNFIR